MRESHMQKGTSYTWTGLMAKRSKVTGYVQQNGDALVVVFMGRYAVESITFTGTGGLQK